MREFPEFLGFKPFEKISFGGQYEAQIFLANPLGK